MTPGGENTCLHRARDYLRGAHRRGERLGRRREDILARDFRHDQRVALGLRHDVHEGERVGILMDVVAGDFAADDAGEDIVLVIGHLSAPVSTEMTQ